MRLYRALENRIIELGRLRLWCAATRKDLPSIMGKSVGYNLSLWFAGVHFRIAGKWLLEEEYPGSAERDRAVDEWIAEREAGFATQRADLIFRIGALQALEVKDPKGWWWAWRNAVTIYNNNTAQNWRETRATAKTM